MKVTLVNPPSPVLADEKLNLPLGILYLGAVLENMGIDVDVLQPAKIKEDEWYFNYADVFGITSTTPQYHDAVKVKGLIKEAYPKSRVILGGPHASTLPKDCLRDGFDAVVVGEGEIALQELLSDVSQAKLSPIYYGNSIKDLDTIPYPALHLLPIDEIRQIGIAKKTYTGGYQACIIGSRGCPFNCSFCGATVFGRKIRYRTPQNIANEIRELRENYDIRYVKFQDDNFTVNSRWFRDLMLELGKIEDFYFRAHTRANIFDDEIAKLFYRAGGREICFGVESGSPSVLELNNKGVKVEDCEKALQVAKDNNLTTIVFLIFGLPGETRQTCEETKDFLIRNKQYCDVVNLATAIPFPDSAIWADADKFGVEILSRDFNQYWIVGHSSNDKILIRNKDVPLDEMRRLKVEMYSFIKECGWAKKEWATVGKQ